MVWDGTAEEASPSPVHRGSGHRTVGGGEVRGYGENNSDIDKFKPPAKKTKKTIQMHTNTRSFPDLMGRDMVINTHKGDTWG